MATDITDDFIRALMDGDPSLGPLLTEAPAQRRKRFAAALQIERESAQAAAAC